MTLDDGSAFGCGTPEVELYGLRVSQSIAIVSMERETRKT